MCVNPNNPTSPLRDATGEWLVSRDGIIFTRIWAETRAEAESIVARRYGAHAIVEKRQSSRQ
jgi:hypothetical protein